MRPKVFIARPIPAEVEDYIGQYCDYEKWDEDRDIPRELLYEKLKDKEGLITSDTPIDRELLDHAPNLKIVSLKTVGYNNLDIQALKEKNVIGTNTPFVLDDTVADLIFALILAAARRIAELDKYVKEGRWEKEVTRELYGIDVHHATIGIIGMGRIGEAVAKRARFGFDMNVLYHNRRRKEEAEKRFEAVYCEFEDLLKKSDFVVVMTPLTSDTERLIDYRHFNMMKKSAIFINASRGKVVNEDALIDALENNKILGAGIDTFYVEPIDKNSRLLKLNNVVTVPHIGSATEKTEDAMAMRAAENLVKGLLGDKDINIVDELRK